MKVLSCNLRGFGETDGLDAWIHRKGRCVDVIKSQNADVICFQELEQFSDIAAAFPDYDSYAMADEPSRGRPMNAIFYHKARYVRLSAGGYWLSETPHVTGSKSWDSACVRLANWICLRDRATGVEFRVINTHLDHIGQVARERQAKLIVEDASAYPADHPQILTGDMNCDAGNPAIGCYKAGAWIDTYGAVHGTEDPGHTFHEFRGPDYDSTIGKMDWIFVRGGIKAVDAAVITESREGRFPSDHYFISATLNI